MGKFKVRLAPKRREERRPPLPLRRWLGWAAPFGILVVCFAVFGAGASGFVHASGLFDVARLEVWLDGRIAKGAAARAFEPVVKDSIFHVNLRRLGEGLSRVHPEASSIELRRRFPSTLIVDVRLRRAVAQVRWQDRHLLVDEKGIVVVNSNRDPKDSLPVVSGIEAGTELPPVGASLPRAPWEAALIVLKEVHRAGLWERERPFRVELSDRRNIVLFLSDGLEVRLGGERLRARLHLLRKLLDKFSSRRPHIRYLDLRFKDVVIGPRFK